MAETPRGPHHLLVREAQPGAIEVGRRSQPVEKHPAHGQAGPPGQQHDLMKAAAVLARGGECGSVRVEACQHGVGGSTGDDGDGQDVSGDGGCRCG